jgi:hypothetical protein
MDDIDSGRVSEPTTSAHNPQPHQQQKSTRHHTMAATSAASAATIHQRQTLPPLGKTLSTPLLEKRAFHSYPPLASRFAWSILHRLPVTAPPATSTAAHIRLSGCGHAPKPPRLSMSTRRADGGEGKVRIKLLACFN